jgi:hypothetical protein
VPPSPWLVLPHRSTVEAQHWSCMSELSFQHLALATRQSALSCMLGRCLSKFWQVFFYFFVICVSNAIVWCIIFSVWNGICVGYLTFVLFDSSGDDDDSGMKRHGRSWYRVY